ncbi:DUF58 domain-containing protein [Hydrocarboniphaga sp.]|uniref:DUF58 domain-containing protein n=1 Tax=Hydrocarboniphaga sp. TaxID=2033016 RepID=UPI003D0B3023
MSPALIPPDVYARLAGLRLGARLATGQGIGAHNSRARGAGLEFAQYRGYEPGDEPRRVDWKLYARSDRFFVREAERDSPLTAWIIVDASASMAQIDVHAPERSRITAARSIAACIAELALRQNDRFGLVVGSGGGLSVIDAAYGRRQRDRIDFELRRIQPQGGFPTAAALRPVWEKIAPSSVVLMLSDGFEEGAIQLAEKLSAAQREVGFVRVLTADERDFRFEGSPRFRDPESPADQRRVDATAARDGFLQRFGAARSELRRRLASAGVRVEEHVADEAADGLLRRLLRESP